MKHACARGGVVGGAPNIEGRAAEEELFIFKLGLLFTPTAVLNLNQLKLLLNSDQKKVCKQAFLSSMLLSVVEDQ